MALVEVGLIQFTRALTNKYFSFFDYFADYFLQLVHKKVKKKKTNKKKTITVFRNLKHLIKLPKFQKILKMIILLLYEPKNKHLIN